MRADLINDTEQLLVLGLATLRGNYTPSSREISNNPFPYVHTEQVRCPTGDESPEEHRPSCARTERVKRPTGAVRAQSNRQAEVRVADI